MQQQQQKRLLWRTLSHLANLIDYFIASLAPKITFVPLVAQQWLRKYVMGSNVIYFAVNTFI